jgi:uncharacterized protein YoxC
LLIKEDEKIIENIDQNISSLEQQASGMVKQQMTMLLKANKLGGQPNLSLQDSY